MKFEDFWSLFTNSILTLYNSTEWLLIVSIEQKIPTATSYGAKKAAISCFISCQMHVLF